MYMPLEVGVAELRQNLSKYLKLVRAGERVVVTDHNRPVAELSLPSETESKYDRLVREGRLIPAKRDGLPEPLVGRSDTFSISDALDQVRGDR